MGTGTRRQPRSDPRPAIAPPRAADSAPVPLWPYAAMADGALRDHCCVALRLLWKKFLWTWANRELPNTSDIDWQTNQSWLFRLPLFPLSFGMLLPLALAGGLLAAAKLRQLPLSVGLLVTGTLVPVLLFTNARFRLIMAPALILLGGFACARLQSLLREPSRHRGPLLRAAAGMVIGLVVAWAKFFDVRTYQIPQIAVNTGVLERSAGQYSAAVAHLRAGLAGDPSDARVGSGLISCTSNWRAALCRGRSQPRRRRSSALQMELCAYFTFSRPSGCDGAERLRPVVLGLRPR